MWNELRARVFFVVIFVLLFIGICKGYNDYLLECDTGTKELIQMVEEQEEQ